MNIDNPNLLFPGDLFALNCQFKKRLKSVLNRDKIKGSSSSSSSGNSDDNMAGGSHSVTDYREKLKTINCIHSLESEDPVYSDEVKTRVDMCEIKKGATFDVLSLLSKRCGNSNANHLVRIIDGQIQSEVVPVDCLKGKLILLCCVFAPYSNQGSYATILQTLSLWSRELSVRSDIEMVLAVKVRPQWPDYLSVTKHFVSTFSCLAVPFDHLFRIDSICMSLNLGTKPIGILVDANQVVIQDSISFIFRAGMVAFPFTDTNVRFHYRFSRTVMRSLDQILASNVPAFPYRICHGKHEVTSVPQLRQKLVGLYLLITGYDMPMLTNVYRQCQARGLEFEVVVFCMPFQQVTTPEGLEQAVTSLLKEEKIPWWVFPFNTTVFSRLQLRSHYDVEDRLFIVLPNGKLMEPHGELVIRHFGIDAYPFTREGVVMKALDKVRCLTLESSLLGGVLYHGWNQVSVSHLRGRNVILCLADVETSQELNALLIRNYAYFKAKDPHMEVVYACLDKNIPQVGMGAISNMPWLVYVHDPSKSEFLADDLFVQGHVETKIVAFGKDGWITSLRVDSHLRRGKAAAFPFCGDLVQEIFEELSSNESRLRFDMVWSDRS